jgi:hypothetical protein
MGSSWYGSNAEAPNYSKRGQLLYYALRVETVCIVSYKYCIAMPAHQQVSNSCTNSKHQMWPHREKPR